MHVNCENFLGTKNAFKGLVCLALRPQRLALSIILLASKIIYLKANDDKIQKASQMDITVIKW